MRRLLTSNRGLTLIEVLLTLTIMTIISSLIYSSFTTGLKLYQKIGIEGQLRDDADYVATMILNEMYNNPPHYTIAYEDTTTGAKGIKMVRYTSKTIDKYIIEESTTVQQDLWIYFENNKLYLKRIDYIKPVTELKEISSESSKFTTVVDGDVPESSISLKSCSQKDSSGKCQHGTISLNIVIGDSNDGRSSFLKTDPLILKSTFGF